MNKGMLSLLLSATVAFSLLTGCGVTGRSAPTPTDTGSRGDWIGPAPTETPPAGGGIVLTDQTGREVTVAAPAEKLVSGYYISTSACIALGLKDRMVGIEKKMIPIYDLAAPEFNDLPKVGTAKEFDLEGCLALEPDLVILPKKLRDAAETISAQGIPVLLVNPESREELVEMLTLIGRATGTEETAAKLAATYEESAAKLEELTSGLSDGQKPTVYLGGNGSYLTTAPRDMYQADLIRLGGGVNAGDVLEGDTWTEVSYEQLLAMDPDVILLPSDASYAVEDVTGDGQLAGVSAVRDGRVYAMPGGLEAWDSPVPSCFLGSEWIMSTLHPDLFPAAALNADVLGFYETFYGVDVSDVING